MVPALRKNAKERGIQCAGDVKGHHVRRHRDVWFNAHRNHHRDGDERRTSGDHTDDACQEENSDENEQFADGHTSSYQGCFVSPVWSVANHFNRGGSAQTWLYSSGSRPSEARTAIDVAEHGLLQLGVHFVSDSDYIEQHLAEIHFA